MLEKSTIDFSLQVPLPLSSSPQPLLQRRAKGRAHPIVDSHPLDPVGARVLSAVGVVEPCCKVQARI